jgi:murein DD-endopeptidase MepM/ murein hydrolase activator NlpD
MRQVPQPKPQAQGRVVNDSKPPVRVQKGDTLNAVSRRTGVSVDTLAKLNDLKSPYRLQPGDTLKLPSRRYYTVQSGDTVYAVAKRFSMDAADLAEFNEFTVGAPIRSGQKLYLPADARDKGPPPAPKPVFVEVKPPRTAPHAAPQPVYPTPRYPTPSAPAPSYPTPPAPERPVPTPAAPIPYRSTSPAPTATPAPTPAYRPPTAEASAAPTDAQIAAAGRGKFIWPVRGDVLSRFGPTGGGQRNDGINISGSANQAVQAAARGEVVYAGNQVPGFGNLVLIKHDGGWVTAYAHLAHIDVKMRQTINQGQTIGQVGQTGSVDQPQLHFELRYAPTPTDKARPVDPMLVLPK